MSQEDAARAIGVGLGTYGSWERGTHIPRREALDMIVEVFNVPPASIGLHPPAGWELVPSEWIRHTHEEVMAELRRIEGVVRAAGR